MILEYILGVLLIGLVTFGGGPVFIPMFEKLFVDQMQIFTFTQYSTIVSVVNSLPGPTGPKIVAYGGYILGGWPLAILGILLLIAPAVLFMLLAYKSLELIKKSPRMQNVSIYIKPIIIGIFTAIIVKFVIQSLSGFAYLYNITVQDNGNVIFSIINTILVFAVSYYLIEVKKKAPILIILGALVYGFVLAFGTAYIADFII